MFRSLSTLLFLLGLSQVWAKNASDPSIQKVFDDSRIEASLSPTEKKQIRKKYLIESDEIELGVKYLRLELAPFVKVLDRDLTTFNYRRLKEMELKAGSSIDVDSPDAVAYAQKWASAAKAHLPNETGMLGWGLYSAADAMSSSSYAQNYDGTAPKFGLVTVKYPRAAVMLDLRVSQYGSISGEPLFKLSSESMKYFKKLCPLLIDGNGEIPKKLFIQEPKCHKVYVKTLESFKVKGLIYSWGFARPSFCNSDLQGYPSYVSIDLDINDASIDFYTDLDQASKTAAEKIQEEKNPELGNSS